MMLLHTRKTKYVLINNANTILVIGRFTENNISKLVY